MGRNFFTLAVAVAVAACSEGIPTPTEPSKQLTFVGSKQCASCHLAETDQWRGSHHQLAMQVATGESILGDFSGASFSYFGMASTFFQRDGEFFVRTENALGELEDFRVTDTFGITPLQQYLVDAPGGRKQALQLAWDSRPENDGGQRWFHLYAGEHIGPNDPLHWTGRYFNWNIMCAECHSTNLEPGYDLRSDSFATTFSEISVGCEACHGSGSLHIEQAMANAFEDSRGFPVNLDDRAGAGWIMNPETGIAERTAPNVTQQQPESCGRCHSRRSVVAKTYVDGTALAETHMLSLLDEGLYHPDGRIQDEVYVYGSFVQSKMYSAGVTCSDCHNPHSGQLHAGPNPNDTCASCHLLTRFATPDHSNEHIGDCVSCHMRATTYMGVDNRRDHSFRLPDTTDDPNHYGAIIAAGRKGTANRDLLMGIANKNYPPIARATMLTLLEPLANAGHFSLLREQLDNQDPLIRVAALRALRQQVPEVRVRYGSHLLRDAIRSVRVEAALTYVEYRDLLPLEDSRAFPGAADDYREAMLAAVSMPGAALRLAEFETRLGNAADARIMYEHAIEIGRGSAVIQHGYGLYLVRSGQSSNALEHLRRAKELAPDVWTYAYAYGIALNSLGQTDDALTVLSDAQKEFPENFDIDWALATIYRDIGDRDSARAVVRRLEDQFPGNERVDALAETLLE